MTTTRSDSVSRLCVRVGRGIFIHFPLIKINFGILLQRHLLWFPKMRSRILRDSIGIHFDLGIRSKTDVPTNLDVRCGRKACGGIRELNDICSNVTDVGDGREIKSGTDSEVRYFDS